MIRLARRRAIHQPLPRRRLVSSTATAVGALLLSACVFGRHPQQIAPRRSPARDSLLIVDARRIDTLAARGPATAAEYFAPDIVYLRARAPAVFGRANVMALLSAGSGGVVAVGCQPLGGGLSVDAMSGYTFGIAVYAEGDSRVPAIARYVAFWTRQRGTPWQIAAYAEIGAGSPTTSGAQSLGGELPRSGRSLQALRTAKAIAVADSDFANDAAIVGTSSAFANAAASYGVIFGGPELIIGPQAIKDYFEGQRGTSLSWHPIYAYGAESGDLGFTVGESVATTRGQSGAAVQRFGKYLTVWRREPNGVWKFAVDGGNSRPSPVER